MTFVVLLYASNTGRLKTNSHRQINNHSNKVISYRRRATSMEQLNKLASWLVAKYRREKGLRVVVKAKRAAPTQ